MDDQGQQRDRPPFSIFFLSVTGLIHSYLILDEKFSASKDLILLKKAGFNTFYGKILKVSMSVIHRYVSRGDKFTNAVSTMIDYFAQRDHLR